MRKNRSYIRILTVILILNIVSFATGCGNAKETESDGSSFYEVKDSMQKTQIGNDTDMPVEAAKQDDQIGENKKNIDDYLYTDESDKEYLCPDTDDYMVIIYKVPEVLIIPDYIVYKDSYGIPMGYGLSRGGNEYKTSCEYTKVISFDNQSKISVKEKLEFSKEEDALRPILASYVENWIPFDGGNIPADFDEQEAILKIADQTVPSYYAQVSDGAKIKRKGAIWYGTRQDSSSGYMLPDMFLLSLRDSTKYFKARNTDEDGFNSFTMAYDTNTDSPCEVTVYYSKPFCHGKPSGEEITLENISKRLNNPDDALYFTPQTDDYLYYIEKGEMILMSFDENGDLVQWVTRYDDSPDGYGNVIYDDDYLPYFILSEDKMIKYDLSYKIAVDNDCLKTESSYGHNIKYDYIKDYYFDMMISDYATLLLSKGITKKDTEFKNDEDVMLENMKKLVPEGSKDYLIRIDKDKFSTEGSKGYYESIGYYWATIDIFDEYGYRTDVICVQIFDDPSMIEQEDKRTFGTELDENGNIVVNHTYYDPWMMENDPKTLDNLYYYYEKHLDEEYKWDLGRFDEDRMIYYYSVPYLTDKQIEMMDEYYR